MELPQLLTADSVRQMRSAMRLSLAIGILMLISKTTAFWLTGSAAILSDAAESIVHVVAVGFAAFSLWLSTKPADSRFPFGYERITFFSAGFEGALIILAAVTIIYQAIQKWLAGLPLENVGFGASLILAASVVNAALGWYLVRVGRRNNSLILEANGKHVLTDSWTSFGVVGGLLLVMATGWKPFDPLCAIAVALNILWSGSHLVWRSVRGLLDYSDPAMVRKLDEALGVLADELNFRYHAVRCRNAGYRLIIHVHLLFPFHSELGDAHSVATEVEARLPKLLETPAEVVTHLDSEEDHGVVHQSEHFDKQIEKSSEISDENL